VSGSVTTPLWEQVGLSSRWHTSVLLNGYLFGPDGNNSEGAGRSPTSLRCLDWKTGEIKWTEPKLGFNGLIAVGGKLLVLTEVGDLVLVDASPDAYKELGSAHVIEGRAFTAPSFANGKAYVRNTKGDVVALDLSGK
jgi:outer membrane protein assembly factor BamB